MENLPHTPSGLTQQQISDVIVNCEESEIREWDLQVNGGFDAMKTRSMKAITLLIRIVVHQLNT
jgi:hypothetical protein